MSLKSEVSFKTYNTRRNLPPQSGRHRSESNFVGALLKSYMRDDKGGHWCGRHFAVPDCGVADCIVFRLGAKDDEMAMEHLIDFEAKLSDWGKALAQAYRYRYYANSSVVIMPAEGARSAVQNGNLFERFGIGLWTFDPGSGTIQDLATYLGVPPLLGAMVLGACHIPGKSGTCARFLFFKRDFNLGKDTHCPRGHFEGNQFSIVNGRVQAIAQLRLSMGSWKCDFSTLHDISIDFQRQNPSCQAEQLKSHFCCFVTNNFGVCPIWWDRVMIHCQPATSHSPNDHSHDTVHLRLPSSISRFDGS